MHDIYAKFSVSRRNFLKGTGSLVISFSFLGGNLADLAGATEVLKLPGSLRRTPRINAWLEVLTDGRVRIFSGKVELGQGIGIAIKQVAAEELEMDLDRVEILLAETGRTPNEGYTAGSGSIQNSAMAVRYAAASAKQKLLELAASKLNTRVDQLTLDNGFIRHRNGNRKLSFHEVLNGKQIEGEVEMPVPLKAKKDYRFVGKSIPREENAEIVRGAPFFIQDLQFPDMVHARVLRPLNYNSELIHVDKKTFEAAAPRVLKTVVDGSFLGVITETEYEAEKALKLLEKYCDWSKPAIAARHGNLAEHIKQIASPPQTVKETGKTNTDGAAIRHRASYFKPYIMHASMGPACAIAIYEEDILHVWSDSQGIYPLRQALQSMLGMSADQIHIIGVPGAGCFGHTVADDAAADAALLALAYPGRHIRVQWSLRDQHTWEPYGSAQLMELEASLDEDGKIQYFHTEVWSDSHSTRPRNEAGSLLTARYLEKPFPLKSRGFVGGGHRNADPYYDIPNIRVDAHFFDGPLRVSSLRSLGAFANIFALESFMDELALKAGKEPIAFRLEHLSDPRAIAVVREIEKMTPKQSMPSREGIGYAFSRYKNTASYCAVAAKVAVEAGAGKVSLDKLWAAVDVGEVINADGIRNQIEGGMVQAASWTLKEEVRFDENQIISQDWISYPILTSGEAPELEVVVLDRPEEPAMGGGEVSVPPVGAAIANAIFQACGQRVYNLPVRLDLKV